MSDDKWFSEDPLFPEHSWERMEIQHGLLDVSIVFVDDIPTKPGFVGGGFVSASHV